MEKLDKKEITAFVSKLNDRNLQRKRESGFTTYALLAILGYCVFFLIDNSYELFVTNNWRSTVRLIAITLNSVSILFFYYSAILSFFLAKPEIKIYSAFQEKHEFLSIFSLSILLLLYLFFNSLAAYSYQGMNGNGYFTIISVLLVLNLISPYIYRYAIAWYRKKKLKNLKITLFKEKQRKGAGISLLIYGTLFLLFTIYQLNTYPLVVSEVFTLSIKYGIITFTLGTIIMFLFEKVEEKNKYIWLENLEKQIYFDDLSKEEVLEKLQQEIFGINLPKWTNKRKQEINDFIKNKSDKLEKFHIEMLQISKIPDNLKYEIEGRKNNFKENFSKNLEEIIKFKNDLSSQLNHMAKFGSISKNDVEVIKDLSKYFNTEIKKITDVLKKIKDENQELTDV